MNTGLSLGAENYLRQFFKVPAITRLNATQALTLCENAEVDPDGEDHEIWMAYQRHHGLMFGDSCPPEKFMASKFYREHK